MHTLQVSGQSEVEKISRQIFRYSFHCHLLIRKSLDSCLNDAFCVYRITRKPTLTVLENARQTDRHVLHVEMPGS